MKRVKEEYDQSSPGSATGLRTLALASGHGRGIRLQNLHGVKLSTNLSFVV